MLYKGIRIGIGALTVASVLIVAPKMKAAPAAGAAPTASVASEFRPPMSFELNEGQAGAEIKALSRGRGYGLLLTATESVLVLTRGADAQQTVLRFKTVGSNPAAPIMALDQLPGTVSYYTGNDPSKWRSGIRTYAKIKYDSVYPGIDLVYYGNQREVEYDFVVAPGADPSVIRFEITGAQKIRVTDQGDLALETKEGVVRHRKPILYQSIDGQRRSVEGRFVLHAGSQVTFAVGAYDRAHELVIDPTLETLTYFGDSGIDQVKAVAVTSPSGLTFFGGLTTSATLPDADNTFAGGPADGFVSAINSNANDVLLTLFLGGTAADLVNGLALENSSTPDYLVVAGVTGSSDFPSLNAAQPAKSGNVDAFVTKFDIAIVLGVPSATLSFSTYLGGTNVDQANGVAVSDPATGGAIFVAGTTYSTDFPTQNAIQGASGGGSDMFLTKYSNTGVVAYSTYFGGAASDSGMGVAVYNQAAPAEAIPFVAGTVSTASTASRAFVFTLDAAGSALRFSKMFGASTAATTANGIAVDSSGGSYITGSTTDAAFPAVNAVQPAYGGNTDAYIVHMDAAGTTMLSTYYGGVGFDRANGITVDTFSGGNNNIAIVGMTTGQFPATAVDTTFGGGQADAFVVMVNGLTHALVYATYLGGAGEDILYAVCIGSAHNARVAGITNSAGIATPGAAQTIPGGGYDGFIARINTN